MASTARRRVKGEASGTTASGQEVKNAEPSSRRGSVDVPLKATSSSLSSSKSKPSSSKETPAISPYRWYLKATLLLLSFTCFTLAALPLVWNDAETNNISFDQPVAHVQPAAQSPARPPPPPASDRMTNQGRYTSPLPFSIDERPLTENVVRGADREKQAAVQEAFRESWDAYVEDAFGADEYHPISRRGSNFSADGGVGYFVIDTIDVLLIMGDREEYRRARDWVRTLDWSKRKGKFSVFETTIRTLGGLLSAHALCTPGQDTLSSWTSTLCSPGDAGMYLEKAILLAERLKPAFQQNKLGIPMREVDFQSGETFSDVDNRNYSSLAEVASIQLEFKYLAHLTGQVDWWTLAEKPMHAVAKTSRKARSEGLLPIFIEPISGESVLSSIRLGSRGDSYYEYLLKQYVQTNHSESVYGVMYRRASSSIKRRLMAQSPKKKLLYTTEIEPRMAPDSPRPKFFSTPKQDHLVCFLGGNYMLGAIHVPGDDVPSSYKPPPKGGRRRGYEDEEGKEEALNQLRTRYPLDSLNQLSPHAQEDWMVGHELIKTCVDTYTGTKTGLAAEITMFRAFNDGYYGPETDWYIKKGAPNSHIIDSRNILRPETVESLFIAFHLTGDEIYRQWGWQIFQAFVKVTKIKKGERGRVGAFSGIKDVQQLNNKGKGKIDREDRMETFWLAETLKYLYLLFSDQDTLRLDQWVLNTEAHPLPVFQPTFRTTVV